ncbi:periplasmic chaperone [Klebsiella michiganensis]|nr:periplasmic chaperone [Klebsiella michiganensis]
MNTQGIYVKNKLKMTRGLLAGMMMTVLASFTSSAEAGVALGATRVIYPAELKQVQLAVTNNDEKSTYLIQSWIENNDGSKDGHFVITPPLFSMQGKKKILCELSMPLTINYRRIGKRFSGSMLKLFLQWINQSLMIIPCSWQLSAVSSSIIARQTWRSRQIRLQKN